MAITYFNSGAATAAGTTSVVPALPASTTAGMLAVVVVTSGVSTDALPTITAGWSFAGSVSGGDGAFGAGTGVRRTTMFVRELQGSDGNPTVSLTSGNTMKAAISVFQKAATDGDWCVNFSGGGDASAGTGFSATGAVNNPMITGDMLCVGYSLNDATNFTAMGVTATGATISATTERVDSSQTTGNDLTLGIGTADVTAGSSTAAPVITATLAAASAGSAATLRIRAAEKGFRIRLWPTTNGDQTNFTDANTYTLGMEFEVTAEANAVAGYIWCRTTGQNTAARTLILYRVDSATVGTIVAQATSSTLTAGAWTRVPLIGPNTLVVGQRYRIAYSSSQGGASSGHSSTANYWSSGDGQNGLIYNPISAPNSTNATGADQGSFFFGGTGFPNDSSGASNYWVDIEVEITDGGDTPGLVLPRW